MVENILEVAQAAYTYPGNLEATFADIGFRVCQNDVVCILGPNGVGKSTLLRCLAGLAPLTTGRVFLDGRDLASLARREVAAKIAYVPQTHHPVFAYSVFDMVLMGRAPHLGWFATPTSADKRIAENALETLGIAHLAAKPYTEISGGERQLALFARVLAQQPRLLLLDEPTSHLDFANQVQVIRLINRLSAMGIAVAMTTHFPEHAFATADVVITLGRERRVRVGPPKEVLTESALWDLYGVAVRIVHDESGTACIPGFKDAVP